VVAQALLPAKDRVETLGVEVAIVDLVAGCGKPLDRRAVKGGDVASGSGWA
jgi:hypothetical protein